MALSCLLVFPASLSAARDRAQKHFLWAVESERNTVYLLGSMHILKQDSYPLPAAIESTYGCCRKIVFETDLDGMNDPESQGMIMKKGLYPQGQKLSEHISSETYSLLQKRLATSGLSIAQFEQFRPWFMALSIGSMELQRLGYDPNLGIDRYFFEKAKRDGKEKIFFEANSFQLNLMASLNNRHQDMFLKGVLKELDVVESLAADMLDAWETGNTGKLDAILQKSHSEDPAIYKRFFTDRNRNWVSKIRRFLKQHDDVLIIVGAGHLVGKDSVVDLLRQHGYKVRQK
jgi:uncharacterized protein YbaP (TraB family)